MAGRDSSCSSCKWFDFDGAPTTSLGLCRVMPPTVIPSQQAPTPGGGGGMRPDALTKPFTTWPVVRINDWCGEHEDENV